jgi:N-acetylglucosaminyldiphosphoundecaprenol N-acetyl-beta-D-mannosaminyltransferase
MRKEDFSHVKSVSGIPFHTQPHDEVLMELDRNIKGPRKRCAIQFTNSESMYFARRMADHRRFVENVRFSLCDGMGVVIAARLQGQCVHRFNGPVFMLKACEYGVSRGWCHFFCGGEEGVAELLSKKLAEKFPGMITAGVFCPPFRAMTESEEKEMVDQINAAKPDILWVGLGLLKQERWIASHIEKIDAPWMIGVGAAFNYHAGVIAWAPAWIRRIGFEWLYRFCFEPRRLFMRNVRSFLFLFEAALESVRGVKSSSVVASKQPDESHDD